MSFFKENWKYFGASLLITVAISYGLSDFLDFTKSIFLVYSLNLAGFVLFKYKTRVEAEDTAQLDSIFSQFEEKIEEQEAVIRQYEDILDTQFVVLRCDCGESLFNGFLSNDESLIECSKCQSSYKVLKNYNQILLSEPLEEKTVINTLTKVAENSH